MVAEWDDVKCRTVDALLAGLPGQVGDETSQRGKKCSVNMQISFTCLSCLASMMGISTT